MIHPDTELRFISQEIGYGVVATRFIPRGTITWARDDFDQIFSPDEVASMSRPYRQLLAKYTFVDAHGHFVLCWDLARYVNHSCHPACIGTTYDFDLAIRDILPGEELTDDYGALSLDAHFRCFCGAPDCRRIIGADDSVKYADAWDAILAEAFPFINAVEQPLWQFVKQKRHVELALAGRTPAASFRSNHHQERLGGDIRVTVEDVRSRLRPNTVDNGDDS